MENTEKVPAVVREIKLSYSCAAKPSQLPQIKTSEEVYKHLVNFWDKDKIEFVEQFQVVLLNRANRILGICKISEGGLSGTVVDPKLIFSCALKANASSIILAHNHPSGNLNPSESDRHLTKKLVSAGKYLDLTLVDHIIVTSEGYYSFADDGNI